MGAKKITKAISPEFVSFADSFRERLRSGKGSLSEIAEETGFTLSGISLWGKKRKTSYSLPNIFEAAIAARAKNASPAWLAYGLGPRDRKAAETAFAVNEEEALFINLCRALTEEQKKSLYGFLSSIIHSIEVPEDRAEDVVDALAAMKTRTLMERADLAPARVLAATAKPPAKLAVQVDRDFEREHGRQLTTIENRSKPVNRRGELKVFQIDPHPSHDAPKTPRWLDLAAGEGADLQLSEDYTYFRELPDWKHVHSAVVRGDSMIETLVPGDIVLLREFPRDRTELPQIENKDEQIPLRQFEGLSGIKQDDICVIGINSEPPTLKRVHYDTSRGEKHWKMQIVADNPAGWNNRFFQVTTEDHIRFYAKLIGIGEGKRTNIYDKRRGEP